MNFIAQESPQKLRGGFYTDSDIADFLTRWALEKKPARILEPSCGDGAFLGAIGRVRPTGKRHVFACELDAGEAKKAQDKLMNAKGTALNIHTGDFLKWFLFHLETEQPFGSVVGNPPFIRYQYLPSEQQFLAEKVFSRFGLPFTKHTNAWVPFVVASLALLEPGGRLAMVIPSEIFHIPHAQSLRRFLSEQCSRILIFDPEELWFEDALQGVVLLLAEKKKTATERSRGLAVCPVDNRNILCNSASAYFENASYTNGESISGKWMSVFLREQERTLLNAIRHDSRFSAFGQLADVDVGIVTGANKFFLVTDDVVDSFGLGKWAHPMFGRSEHVTGVVFNQVDLQNNRKNGLPTNFLWFDDAPFNSFPASVQRYLRSGEEQGLPKRYKCRIRSPWFRVPSVYTAPVAMLKRAHHCPRLVLNKANSFTTDTAYRIRPSKLTGTSLVYSFFNSLTSLSAELEGRHYGGGVLELVPSEIERLLLPVYPAREKELASLDARFRSCNDVSQLLYEQDRIVLTYAGLSASEIATLHEAWDRLKNRRQRNKTLVDEVAD
jgi:adenine-specific DNA methylase